MDRPWFREALAADAPEQVRRQVAGTGEILRRVAGCSTWSAPPPRPTPNWSSCGGPTWRSGHAVRLRLAEALAEKAALRPDLTPARAADVCLATLTPETYLLLVDDRAWSHEQWEHWATDTLTRQLLTRPPSA
ncbi:hypothetical protein [Saccharomonospora marina]|uniref:hypothetical protein n=1 Tax=Saccharomonospora marina TaxID=632569 RepID=UPI000301B287|nr:hypothetical protein [Saccharomonospora marina]